MSGTMRSTMRSTMSSILCHLRAGKGILKTARECGVGKRYGVQRIAEENEPFAPRHEKTPLNVSRSLPLMTKLLQNAPPPPRDTSRSIQASKYER
jgi:hypothetical protein